MTSHPESRGGLNRAPEMRSEEMAGTPGRTQQAGSDSNRQELQPDDFDNTLLETVSDTPETENEKSPRSSLSHWDPEPGFAHIDGDVAGSGYNETTVDIVAVPCIGASPVDTWGRDPLIEDYFEAAGLHAELKRYETVKELPGGAVLSPAINRNLPKANQLWIRQGIRKEVNKARVLLYRHRELTEGYTLSQAADDLLEHVSRIRAGLKKSRPIFFICHSIGGLVAKLALVKASKEEGLRPLIFDCHGMTFFSTPHRGSSYMSMPHLRESIQQLLSLEKPLPKSITSELRLGYKPLLRIHDQFTDMASELRIWTFYETVDSQLSGLGSCDWDEVHFSAPLVSIKSCLIGTRAENAFSLESDHANCASFGSSNLQTMHSYLRDLRRATGKAEYLSANFQHSPLMLADKVKLELIGFFGDPESDGHADIRLYISRYFLREFLEKGPELCLHERLSTIATKPRRAPLRPSRAGTQARGETDVAGGRNIWSNVQEFSSRLFGQGRSSADGVRKPGEIQSPEIVVTSHPPRPSIAGAAAATEPPPLNPVIGPRRSRGLPVPSLSPPGRHRPSSRNSGNRARSVSDPGGADVLPRTTDDDGEIDSMINRDAFPGVDEADHTQAAENKREDISRDNPLHELSAGFLRPNPSRRKFMWIHLPFNNPHWVNKIFDKLSETYHQNYSNLLSNDLWAKRHVQGRHANLQGAYVKPGCAFVQAESSSSSRPSSSSSQGTSRSPGISPKHLYLYMPYLHFDTYKNLIRRRNVIRRRMSHGRSRPVPQDIAELESLDCRVIWEYIGHDPPLNARRTLDQYGYPALRDTYARDDDQMLYKLTKERMAMLPKDRQDMYNNTRDAGDEQKPIISPGSPLAMNADTPLKSDAASYKYESNEDLESDILDGNVLMVDQLWLWAIDETTLTTFFPKRESYPTEGPMFQQADLRNSVYHELNGDLTGRCETALDLAAFVVLHAVTVLLDRTSHPDLEIFRIFEEAIGILSERMTSSLKRFRMQTFRDNKILDESLSSSDSEDGDSGNGSDPEDNRSAAIKRRHRRELEQAERENRENTSALLELRDMDDELSTMQTLFAEQKAVIKSMLASYEEPELRDLTEHGRGFLAEALGRLEEYKRQTGDMIDRVETTRKDYEKLLEMVQRQAQVDEVRWSRLQTELASSQNLSVMIFTTFTVIFLPLSFFTSLFGMNTAEWGGDDDNFISLRTIGAISLPASAGIVAASLVLAFSARVQAFFKAFFRALAKGPKKVALLLRTAAVASKKEEGMQGNGDGGGRRRRGAGREGKKTTRWNKVVKEEQQEKRMLRRRERGYDFWETVRRERGTGYEIPELNRKRATQRRLAGRGTWKRIVKEGW